MLAKLNEVGACIVCGRPAIRRAHFYMCDDTYRTMSQELPADPEDIAHYAGAQQTFKDLAEEHKTDLISFDDVMKKMQSYSIATKLTWSLINKIDTTFTTFPVPRLLEGKENPDMEIWKRGIASFTNVMMLSVAAGSLKEFDDIVDVAILAANALAALDNTTLKMIGINLAYRIERFCQENGEVDEDASVSEDYDDNV